MSEQTQKMTPTPWKERGEITTGSMKGFLSIGSSAHPVAFVMRKEDAAGIVQAVNAHEKLVKALEALLAHRHDHDPAKSYEQIEAEARTSLTLAQGGGE